MKSTYKSNKIKVVHHSKSMYNSNLNFHFSKIYIVELSTLLMKIPKSKFSQIFHYHNTITNLFLDAHIFIFWKIKFTPQELIFLISF